MMVLRCQLFFPGYELDSIHEKPSAIDAVRSAEALFIGTGQPHYNAIFGVHRNRPCYK